LAAKTISLAAAFRSRDYDLFGVAAAVPLAAGPPAPGPMTRPSIGA